MVLALSGWRPGESLGGMYLAAFPYFLVGVLVSLAPYLLFSWWTEKAPGLRWPYLAALTVCEAALLTQTWGWSFYSSAHVFHSAVSAGAFVFPLLLLGKLLVLTWVGERRSA